MSKLLNIAGSVTATTGPGTITLGSAIAGLIAIQSHPDITDGDTLPITIQDGADTELSTGTFTASGPTLTRTLVASTTGSLLNLSGSAKVRVTPSAADLRQSILNERSITASATLILDDHNGVIISNSATDIDLTIPPNSSVALPGMTSITVKQAGAGVVSIVDGTGVTSTGDRKTGGQNKALTVYQREALDTWDIFGGVA